MQENKAPETMDVRKIMEYLPHRYPFLLIDRVLEIEPYTRIVGLKCVTANEPQFQGHFPGVPIMPGVLLIEAMAQTGAALLLSKPEYQGKIAYLAGVENCRFRRPVVPGDVMRIEVSIDKFRRGIGKGTGVIKVENEAVAEAVITFAIPE